MTDIEQALQASRNLYPELWEKADAIARIIKPGLFEDWYNSTEPGAAPVEPPIRTKYERSAAIHLAWQILQYLGIAPQETDWAPILEEMNKSDDS